MGTDFRGLTAPAKDVSALQAWRGMGTDFRGLTTPAKDVSALQALGEEWGLTSGV